ncbi:MAG: hypothetical protein WEA09_05390 [Gemmatimonadota bacterium]
MRRTTTVGFPPASLLLSAILGVWGGWLLPSPVSAQRAPLSEEQLVLNQAQERFQADLLAMRVFRPGYAFWQHIFQIPDGSVAFGSARDGRLLAVFPAGGDWDREGRWTEGDLATVLGGRPLPNRLNDRREEVAQRLEPEVGPVMHNATRGDFLLPNLSRYGIFLDEWALIYERFGVPGEVGLAQAMIESGLNGTIRSEARALGFCQWLESNWNQLKRHASSVIEGHNQTTQAPYCAAYLSILATKYGTFIPALSEHHAGGTNVGRTVINGGRLGGGDVREQYFLGSEFARDLRRMAPRKFRDVVYSYGPRSFLYAEMVFGNTLNVTRARGEIPQTRIHAMRAQRPIPLSEVTQRTGLSVDEVRRFNPALVRQVPRGANLYLPQRVEAFGPDVSFWHRAPAPAYTTVLLDFLQLESESWSWDDPSFAPVLTNFRRRFQDTDTEEGDVMAAVLGYVMDEMYTSRRRQILVEFRESLQVQRLVEQGLREREIFLSTTTAR